MSARCSSNPALPRPGAIAAWRCATWTGYEEARASFETVLTLEPNNAVAMNSHGNVLRDMKMFDEAINSYSAAIAVRPDYAEALINRGYTYWALKQFDAGMADVERALRLEPDYPYGRGEVLHVRMYSADWHDFATRKAELEASGARRQARHPALQFPGHCRNACGCTGLFAHLGAAQISGKSRAPTRSGDAQGTQENPHWLCFRRVSPAGHRDPDGGPLRTPRPGEIRDRRAGCRRQRSKPDAGAPGKGL